MNKAIFDIKPAERESHAGNSLRLAMSIYDVSAAEIAKHLGVTRQSVHKILDTKTMNDDRLQAVANYFNLDPNKFLELPHYPITSAFQLFMDQMLAHFRETQPRQVKYLVNKNAEIKDISRIIKMLEQNG